MIHMRLGMEIRVADHLCKTTEYRQVRFPKTKKKRIRKKWSKRHSNWALVAVDRAFKIGDTLYVSSEAYETLSSGAEYGGNGTKAIKESIVTKKQPESLWAQGR